MMTWRELNHLLSAAEQHTYGGVSVEFFTTSDPPSLLLRMIGTVKYGLGERTIEFNNERELRAALKKLGRVRK